MLTPERELFARTKITEKAVEADNVTFGISEPVFFTGKADFAAQIGITKKENTAHQNAEAIKNLLCDFVMTFYSRIDDTKKGTAGCPVMLVTYELLVFQEFRFGLETDTNAHNRHVATVLQIWAKFLTGHKLEVSPLVRHQAMEQVGRTQRNAEVPYLPGVKGFFTNLQVKVEVN